MPHHKITYRDYQGGWIVFDADATNLQSRLDPTSTLPAVFVGGRAEEPDAVERCHAWMEVDRYGLPAGKLTVSRAGNTKTWLVHVGGRIIVTANSQAQAKRLRAFVLELMK